MTKTEQFGFLSWSPKTIQNNLYVWYKFINSIKYYIHILLIYILILQYSMSENRYLIRTNHNLNKQSRRFGIWLYRKIFIIFIEAETNNEILQKFTRDIKLYRQIKCTKTYLKLRFTLMGVKFEKKLHSVLFRFDVSAWVHSVQALMIG